MRPLSSLPSALDKLPRRLFLLLAPIKLLWTAFVLAHAVLSIDPLPRYILVQVRCAVFAAV